MHQLSRRSLLVPVFTAAQPRVTSALSSPKVSARAVLSARMSVTRWLAAASATRLKGAADAAATPPRGSGTTAPNELGALASIATGLITTGDQRPPLASAR